MNNTVIKEFFEQNKAVIISIAGVAIFFTLSYGVISIRDHFKEQQEKAEIAKEQELMRVQKIKDDAARAEVLASMKRLIETGHAETALAVAEENKELLNEEMKALIHLATEKDLLFRIETTSKWNYSELAKYYGQLARIEPDNSKYRKELKGYDRKLNRRLERKLYAEAQTLPAKDYKANMEIYEELMRLNPKEGLYESKFNIYKEKYDSLMKELEKFGDKPKRTADGSSYKVVEDYLKNKSRAPEFLEVESATECYYTDDGWLVGASYSERDETGNRYGEFSWFTINNSTVIKVEPGSTYTVE